MQVAMVAPADLLARLPGMAPGAELAAALACLHLPAVPNGQVVDVLQAQARQLAHDQARLAATLLEVARTTPYYGPDDPASAWTSPAERAAEIQEWAEGEIAAALTWSPGKAGWELRNAHRLIDTLPAVHAALAAGLIDRQKADVFVEYLDPENTSLTRAQIDRLVAQFLPPAQKWTRRQLAARLLRAIIAIDPGAARARYQRAVRARGVICQLDGETGTAMITASGLPPDEATAACARLDRLAATIKRAGHPGRLRHIAADLFLGMLDGRWHGHTEHQIITDLLTRRRPEDPIPTQPDQPDQPGAQLAGPAGPAGPDPISGEFSAEARDRGPASAHTASATAPDRRAAAGEPAAGEHAPVAPGPVPGPPVRWEARAGIEIRVGLSTLLGHDQRPGEIPGLGPVTAENARTAVAAQRRGAQWRFAVVDDDGYLLLAGVIRRRPQLPTPDPPAAPIRGGIVELNLPATLLTELAADPALSGEWAGVVAEIAGQYACREQLRSALDSNPRARFARGALARHIQVRDRFCCHPGCGRPAVSAELDHTRDHAAGGPTTTVNLGPNCERHHWYKTTLGWRLRQPEPGHYEWTSPLGQAYRTRGEPIRPELPEPLPRDHDRSAQAEKEPRFDAEDWQPDLPILHRTLKPPEPPPPRPPPPPDDEPPPF